MAGAGDGDGDRQRQAIWRQGAGVPSWSGERSGPTAAELGWGGEGSLAVMTALVIAGGKAPRKETPAQGTEPPDSCPGRPLLPPETVSVPGACWKCPGERRTLVVHLGLDQTRRFYFPPLRPHNPRGLLGCTLPGHTCNRLTFDVCRSLFPPGCSWFKFSRLKPLARKTGSFPLPCQFGGYIICPGAAPGGSSGCCWKEFISSLGQCWEETELHVGLRHQLSPGKLVGAVTTAQHLRYSWQALQRHKLGTWPNVPQQTSPGLHFFRLCLAQPRTTHPLHTGEARSPAEAPSARGADGNTQAQSTRGVSMGPQGLGTSELHASTGEFECPAVTSDGLHVT